MEKVVEKLKIEIAKPEDFNEFNEVFPQTKEGIEEFNLATGNNEQALYLLVRNENNKLIGKLYLKFFGSTNKIINEKISQCPDLENIEVVPFFRGKGIGTKLILRAEEICREKGFHKVGLGVSLENHRARSLYEKLSYKDVGLGTIKISFMWRSKLGEPEQEIFEDIIYMVKEL